MTHGFFYTRFINQDFFNKVNQVFLTGEDLRIIFHLDRDEEYRSKVPKKKKKD